MITHRYTRLSPRIGERPRAVTARSVLRIDRVRLRGPIVCHSHRYGGRLGQQLFISIRSRSSWDMALFQSATQAARYSIGHAVSSTATLLVIVVISLSSIAAEWSL